MKFIHTADWQLSKPFAGVDDVQKRSALQQESIEVIKHIASDGKSGNQSLCTSLGWDESTYTAVKDGLVASGQITPERDRGGSVSLLDELMQI